MENKDDIIKELQETIATQQDEITTLKEDNERLEYQLKFTLEYYLKSWEENKNLREKLCHVKSSVGDLYSEYWS